MNLISAVRYVMDHPSNKGRRLAALADGFCWQVHKRAKDGPWMRSLGVDSLKFLCWPDSVLGSAMAYTRGRSEFHEFEFLRRYLKHGEAFLDIGANIGLYTIWARGCVGASGHVDAYEPAPEAASRLRRLVELNALRNVTIHQEAIGENAGTANFALRGDQWNRLAARGEDGPTIPVEVVTLDTVLSSAPYSAAKIDVEGSEWGVFRSGREAFATGLPPVWIVEWNGLLNDFGEREEAFRSWLSDRGFELMTYDGQTNRLLPKDQQAMLSPNLFAVYRQSLNDVLNRLQG